MRHTGTVDKRDKFKLKGNTIAGTFRVDEVVAEGGFGIVYKAFHLHFRSPVALKCLKIPGELNDEERQQFLEQFRSEAEIQFRLSAALPNIVRPLHVDAIHTDDGGFIPMMALEWLEGLSFETIIENKNFADEPAIPLQEALELIGPAAQALHQAHNFVVDGDKLAVIHRDIKPDNLFLTEINGKKVVKLLDFGISKVRRAATQLAGHFSQTAGTAPFSPAYGAPEQWVPKRFGQTGPWTDVWGLALTLVEIIKGDAVIVGDHQAMMGTALDPKVRPSPRSEGVTVSDEVESVFLKALSLDPRYRYQSIESFWEALQAAVLLTADGSPAYQETPSGSMIELPPMSAPTPWKSPADAFEESAKKTGSLPPMLAPARMARTSLEDQQVLEKSRAPRASYPMDPNSDLQPVPAAPTDWNHFDPETPPSSDDPSTIEQEPQTQSEPQSLSVPPPLEAPPPLELPMPDEAPYPQQRDDPSLKLELAENSVFPSRAPRKDAAQIIAEQSPAAAQKVPPQKAPAQKAPAQASVPQAPAQPSRKLPDDLSGLPAALRPPKTSASSTHRAQPSATKQAQPSATKKPVVKQQASAAPARRSPVPQAQAENSAHPEIPDLAPTAQRSPVPPPRKSPAGQSSAGQSSAGQSSAGQSSAGRSNVGQSSNDAKSHAKMKARPAQEAPKSNRPPPPRRGKRPPPAPSRQAAKPAQAGAPPPPKRPNRPPPPQRSPKEKDESEAPLDLVPTGNRRSAS